MARPIRRGYLSLRIMLVLFSTVDWAGSHRWLVQEFAVHFDQLGAMYVYTVGHDSQYGSVA